MRTTTAALVCLFTLIGCGAAPASKHDALVAAGCFPEDIDPAVHAACTQAWNCGHPDAGAPAAGCSPAGPGAPGFWCCPE